MTEAMPLARQLDPGERRMLAPLKIAPYILLGLLTGFTVVYKHADGGSLDIDIGLCALAAVWMLGMFTLRPAWRVRPRPMTVFFAGVVAVMAILIVRDPWFGFFTPAGYIYAFSLLRWPWRLTGIAVVAILAGTAQDSGISKHTLFGVAIYLSIVALNVIAMCGATWIDHQSDRYKVQREQALAQAGEANRELTATLAENAGLHEQLLAQAREAGVLDERQRMAREIHDTLAQGLTGIITQLQAAELVCDDPAGWRRHFEAATGLARESLSEARRSVDALRPEPLETAARLSDALTDVARRWSARHGIAVQVTATGTPRHTSAEAELVLLRTAQEGLANVARHAEATRAWVTLSYMEHDVALDVRDDGRGFDPAQAGGFGLIAMRQRVEGLSGTLQVESEPGVGTVISACLPVAGGQG